MISAVIFDLDGTLVQTETLKARSYAEAAAQLRPGEIREADVIRAYDDLIGCPRETVARTLVDRFDLADAAAAQTSALGVSQPWEALAALRMRRYEAMLEDHALLERQELPYAIALLRHVKQDGYPTALTTVSHAVQAFAVIDSLGLRTLFDVILTVDDVAHAKPDPEIYLLAAARLHHERPSCLAIEDSLPGVRAAVAAGMPCVAAATDLTRRSLHQAAPMAGVHIVDDPRNLEPVVRALLATPEGANAWK